MNRAATLIQLTENLKALKLATMSRGMESSLRQARETGVDYDEFLLGLTTEELQVRFENRLKRRIREAKFPHSFCYLLWSGERIAGSTGREGLAASFATIRTL